MSLGCAVYNCWYSRNFDRIDEFSGLEKVVINNFNGFDSYVDMDANEGDVIKLCDQCIYCSDGECEVCGLKFVGINRINKDLCVLCTNHDDIFDLIKKNKKEISKIIVKLLCEFDYITSDKLKNKSLVNKNINEIKINDNVEILNELEMNFIDNGNMESFIDYFEEYEGILEEVFDFLLDDIFEMSEAKHNKKMEYKIKKRNIKNAKDFKEYKKFIPSLTLKKYLKIKGKYGLKGNVSINSIDDMFYCITRNN